MSGSLHKATGVMLQATKDQKTNSWAVSGTADDDRRCVQVRLSSQGHHQADLMMPWWTSASPVHNSDVYSWGSAHRGSPGGPDDILVSLSLTCTVYTIAMCTGEAEALQGAHQGHHQVDLMMSWWASASPVHNSDVYRWGSAHRGITRRWCPWWCSGEPQPHLCKIVMCTGKAQTHQGHHQVHLVMALVSPLESLSLTCTK